MHEELRIEGYHTCSFKSNDCKNDLITRVPFLCDPRRIQWLGVGYYFWTDDVHYAHEWGESGYRGKYSINRFSITMKRSKLLDLVGSVSDQLSFKAFIESLLSKLEQAVNSGDNLSSARKHELQDKLKQVKRGVISTIIDISRQDKLFDFWAIKAADRAKKSSQYPFRESGNSEFLILPTRQQMVVYKEAKECIKHESWVYPAEADGKE